MATGSNEKEAMMDKENKSDDEVEERLNMLKLEKMKVKTSFTKTRRQLLGLLDEFDLPSRPDIMKPCEKLEAVQERAFSVMVELSMEYPHQGDRNNRKKTTQKIEQLHQEFTEAQNRALEYLDNRKDDCSRVSTGSQNQFVLLEQENTPMLFVSKNFRRHIHYGTLMTCFHNGNIIRNIVGKNLRRPL